MCTFHFVPPFEIATYLLVFIVNSSQLQFYDNGTIQLVDLLSKLPRWQFSTGPPLSKHITTSKPDLNYVIYLDGSETSDLIEVHNGSGVVCFAQLR